MWMLVSNILYDWKKIKLGLDLIPGYKTSNDNIIALKVHPLGPNVKGHFNKVFFYFHLKIRRPHSGRNPCLDTWVQV